MAKLTNSKQKPQSQPTTMLQLNILYESTELRGINPIERAKVLAELASLLVQAAVGKHGRADDGEQ